MLILKLNTYLLQTGDLCTLGRLSQKVDKKPLLTWKANERRNRAIQVNMIVGGEVLQKC